MSENENIPKFSLFGGPLNKFGLRLGLIKEETKSTRLGLVIGLSVWIILLGLTFTAGNINVFFSFKLIAAHVKFLLVIPLFFVCETFIAPQMSGFVDYIYKSGLVPDNEKPSLSLSIRRINNVKDSWLIEAVLFLLMFIIPLFESNSNLPGNSTSITYIIKEAGGQLTFAKVFYLFFCLPLFRFMLVRWLWHLCLWWYFLYRVKKLKLNLIPTHSDGAGGLGYLEVVQEYFSILAIAFSATLAASSAEEIYSGTQPFESLYYIIPITLVLNLVFFVAPLLMFFLKLKKCKDIGLHNYMIMSTHYVDAFDKKWIKSKTETGESQLGTADLQSLADLTNSVKVIHDMRTLLVSRNLLISFIVSSTLPFVPFVFLKFNFKELMVLVFQLLTGH